MTKSSKKEERLSPRAKKLIETARTKFVTQPKKAVNYLMSVDPKEFNMYDRQKVGREILARAEDTLYLPASVWDRYQIDTDRPYSGVRGQKKKARDMKENYNPMRWRFELKRSADERLKDARRNKELLLTEGRELKRNGRILSADPLKNEASDYKLAIREYFGVQMYDQAINAGKEFLDHVETRKDKSDISGSISDIKNLITQAQKLKSERDSKRKKTGLENMTAVVSVLGVLGGILLLSNNITGNVVGNASNITNNWIGIVLLLVGIASGIFWFKINN